MRKRYQATPANVEDYWRLFVNRRAYTLQSTRPHPETGRHYYFRPKAGQDGDPLSLSKETIRRHLEGDLTIGLYAVNPVTQRCKWIALDGDYKESLQHLGELQWELGRQKVESALENSRRGAHLWVFAEQPLLARECRQFVCRLAEKLQIPVKGIGNADGIEIFPRHDEVRAGDFGNAIRGPLGVHRAVNVRYWFYGADYAPDEQLGFLKRLKKLSESQLGELIDKLGRPMEAPPKVARPSHRSWLLGRPHFRILDHVEVRRRAGRNWITRCPSCAADGRDNGKDNLSISVEEPQKYKCWAGCTREMIRAALGCPVPEPVKSTKAVR